MSENNQYVASEQDLDALVLYVVQGTFISADFSPLGLHAAIPRLSDDELLEAVAAALELGFFTNVSEGRIRLTLEGRRRATIAKYRNRQAPRLPFEWRSIPAFSLADAVLVYAKRANCIITRFGSKICTRLLLIRRWTT